MNRDIFEDYWKQFKGKAKARCDKPSDDHLDVIADKRIEKASPKGGCMMKEEVPPRRVVLRGALAVGCSLFVPIALFGCDSKKGANSTSSAPASPPDTSANSSAPAATKKVSQASVQYQTKPKGEQKCSTCVNFIAESNTCKLVDGQISPDGWCTLWVKKA